jgi:hypothetical protein
MSDTLDNVISETVKNWRLRARFVTQMWRAGTPDRAEKTVDKLKRDILAETDLDILHEIIYEAILLRDEDL